MTSSYLSKIPFTTYNCIYPVHGREKSWCAFESWWSLLLENIQIQFQSPADIERMLSRTSGFKLWRIIWRTLDSQGRRLQTCIHQRDFIDSLYTRWLAIYNKIGSRTCNECGCKIDALILQTNHAYVFKELSLWRLNIQVNQWRARTVRRLNLTTDQSYIPLTKSYQVQFI